MKLTIELNNQDDYQEGKITIERKAVEITELLEDVVLPALMAMGFGEDTVYEGMYDLGAARLERDEYAEQRAGPTECVVAI